MSEPLRLGIVGCGRVTQTWHAPTLAGLRDELVVVAVADPLAAPRDRVAAMLGARAHAEHDVLVAAEDVEAVAVCVPPDRHAEVVLAALDEGKHVFVEKPLCLTVEEARAVERRVAETGRTLAVGFNLRHHELVQQAQALLDAGALGEVVAVQSVFSSNFDYRNSASAWRFRRELGGGAVFEMASHHFDLWRMLLRDEVEEVYAISRSAAEEDDQTAVVAARTRSGVGLSFLVTQRSGHVNECTVHGTGGTLRLSPYRHDGLELLRAGEFAGAPRLRLRRAVESAWALRRGRAPFARSYRTGWLRFAEAVRAGGPVPGVEDGLRNVEVLAAVLRSAETGAPVRP